MGKCMEKKKKHVNKYKGKQIMEHCDLRARERYNTKFDREFEEDIINQIRNDEATLLDTRGLFKVYLVEGKDQKKIKVLYDGIHDSIVTLFPKTDKRF